MRTLFPFVLLPLLSCAVGFHRNIPEGETEAVGKIVFGFEAPGGHGDVSIGGNLLKEPQYGLERTTDGLLLFTYQIMPYPQQLKRSKIPLISPGFSTGWVHRTDYGNSLYFSGNLEFNFSRFYGPPVYNFGHFYLSLRYYVLFPFRSRHTLPMGVGLEVGLRSSWWRAPW